MRRRRFLHRSGFTLMEMLMAAGILAVALVTICELFVASNSTQMRNDYRTNAAGFCQSVLAEASGSPFDDLIDGTVSGSLPQLPKGNTVETLIQPLDGNSRYRYIKEVRISIKWPGTTSSPSEAGAFEATTLISARR